MKSLLGYCLALPRSILMTEGRRSLTRTPMLSTSFCPLRAKHTLRRIFQSIAWCRQSSVSVVFLDKPTGQQPTGRHRRHSEKQSKKAHRKWPMGNRMVTVRPMTSRDPERSNSWPRYAYGPISWKQLDMLFSNNRQYRYSAVRLYGRLS